MSVYIVPSGGQIPQQLQSAEVTVPPAEEVQYTAQKTEEPIITPQKTPSPALTASTPQTIATQPTSGFMTSQLSPLKNPQNIISPTLESFNMFSSQQPTQTGLQAMGGMGSPSNLPVMGDQGILEQLQQSIQQNIAGFDMMKGIGQSFADKTLGSSSSSSSSSNSSSSSGFSMPSIPTY
jgi:hypothetical protein